MTTKPTMEADLQRLLALRAADAGAPHYHATVDDSPLTDPDADVWTVGPDSDRVNWETDNGCPGYGLPRARAAYLAAAADAVPALIAEVRRLRAALASKDLEQDVTPPRRPRNGCHMDCGCWWEAFGGARAQETRATCPRHGDTRIQRANVDEPSPLLLGGAAEWVHGTV